MKKSFKFGLGMMALALMALLSGCGQKITPEPLTTENTQQNNEPTLESPTGLNLDTAAADATNTEGAETTDEPKTITLISNVKIDKNSDINSLLDGLKEVDTKKINDINDTDLNNL